MLILASYVYYFSKHAAMFLEYKSNMTDIAEFIH